MPDQQGDSSRRRRSGNPAVRAGAVPPSPARARLERQSRPWLLRLAAIPRWLLLLLVLALAVVGLLLPGWSGAIVLLVVAGLAAWLTALAWPALGPGARAARVLILLLILFDVGLKIAAG